MQLEYTSDYSGEASRQGFIRKVYGHLFGSIVAFIGVIYLMFNTELGNLFIVKILELNWGLILGAFVLLGWLARMFASGSNSLPMQYLGLAITVIIQGIITSPLILVALSQGNEVGSNILLQATIVTLVGFGILTMIVFMSKKDFSFLRTLLVWVGVMAFIAIIAALIFNITLGLGFSIAMVAFAGASILYDTSNIRRHYPEDQYVGAAVDLFASVALMFWYVLRIFMSRE